MLGTKLNLSTVFGSMRSLLKLQVAHRRMTTSIPFMLNPCLDDQRLLPKSPRIHSRPPMLGYRNLARVLSMRTASPVRFFRAWASGFGPGFLPSVSATNICSL